MLLHQILLIGVTITDGNNQFVDAGNAIFSLVRTVGAICSVAALMLIGIKYMLSSIEEKAEYKKTFWIYILGVILVFGITSLAEIVYNWVNGL